MKVQAKSEAWESHFMLRECGRVQGNEPAHSQVSSHVENYSPDELLNFQKAIAGVKRH